MEEILSFFCCFPEKGLNRGTKLIAIFTPHVLYYIDGVERKYVPRTRRRLFVTQPNTDGGVNITTSGQYNAVLLSQNKPCEPSKYCQLEQRIFMLQ